MLVQVHLVREFRSAVRVDPLVGEAVQALMPWHPVTIDTLATHLALSASQLRRRCLHSVGVSPKVLQRTLRFQGFLALAQAGGTASGRRGADGVVLLAAGTPNPRIAAELMVSLNTVEKHVSHLLGKLGAANRTEAVSRARQLGLIP